MTSYAEALRDYGQNYWNSIPQNAGKQVLVSFAGAFVVRSLIGNNPTAAMIAGATSATASLIYALITPLFKTLAEDREDALTLLEPRKEVQRGFIAISLTCFLDAFFGKAMLVDEVFFHGFIYFCRVNFLESASRDLGKSNWMIIFPITS